VSSNIGDLTTPGFSSAVAKARGPGRFAWHHEALNSSWKRREESPRPLRRMKNASDYPVLIPADAAGANRPGSRAPTKVLEKSPAGGGAFSRSEEGGCSPGDDLTSPRAGTPSEAVNDLLCRRRRLLRLDGHRGQGGSAGRMATVRPAGYDQRRTGPTFVLYKIFISSLSFL